MSADGVACLATYRRRRARAAAEDARLPLVVTFDEDAVSLVVGAGEDEVEIGLSFDQAEELAHDILRGVRAGLAAKASKGDG